MSRAQQSHAFQNLEFLERLGGAHQNQRLQMLSSLSQSQLRGIEEVAGCIRRKKIRVLRRDESFFRSEKLFLRGLTSSMRTDRRKRRLLVRKHKVLPKLLRRVYIRRSIGHIIRSS